jgi:microcystin-dependent protein
MEAQRGITMADDALANAIEKGIGTVQMWAGPRDKVPSGWLLCDGSEVDSHDKNFAALFQVIGTRFGVGQKPAGFKLPNLDRRIVVGSSKDGGAYAVGKDVGVDTQTASFTADLRTQQMADAFQVNTENGFQTNPVVGANAQSITLDVRQASLVMSYIIRYR